MRQKLPHSLERLVLVNNRHCCCVCQGDGYGKEILIHHIDGNNSNNIESNLAVLCLVHASMADAGLRQGKLGAGKKLKPDSIKQYKAIWQRKIKLEAQRRRETIPLRAKNQLEILYKFEIHKSKNFILSIQDRDKRIKETFDYFDQLVIEEFISGINIRAILLDAYSDLAVQTIDALTLPKRLSKSLWGLLLHLVGPDKVQITPKDKKIFSECLRIFETLGEFAGEFDGGIPVLKAVCKEIYEFAQITSWYKLRPERKRVLSVFQKIHSACSSFEPPGAGRGVKKEINDRQAVVRKYWDKARRLP
jgi:hypothetical protein